MTNSKKKLEKLNLIDEELEKSPKEKLEQTTILSEEQYDGIPFYLKDTIQRHVNWEEKRWYKDEPIPIPRSEKVEVKRNMAGWVNFVKTILFDNVRQLKP